MILSEPAPFERLPLDTSEKFDRIVLNEIYFHLGFWALLLVEAIGFIALAATLIASSLLSIALSGFVFSFFLYLILYSFLTQRKGELIQELKEDTTISLKRALHFKEEEIEHHVLLANAYCTLEQKMEFDKNALPKPLKRLYHYFTGKDLFSFKEALLQLSLKEYIKLVRLEPTSLQMHAALANAYVRLSSHYSSVLNRSEDDEEQSLPLGLDKEALKCKFQQVSKKAIEEFNILNDYAPNEPWVHTQLAISFRDLNMPKEEMREYETILHLKPDDLETSFKLGQLYFQQGEAAKGLRIYERLKRFQPKYAERLIENYGEIV